MLTLELLKKELVVAALQQKLGKEVSCLLLPICYVCRCMHVGGGRGGVREGWGYQYGEGGANTPH